MDPLAKILAMLLGRHRPQRNPPMPWKVALHRMLLRHAGYHPWQDRVLSFFNPLFCYDVTLAQELLEQGKLRPAKIEVTPRSFTYHNWKIRYENNVLAQGPKSHLDLIWVLTMPPERAAEPCLFFIDENGNERILDGSHRLARAVVDGKPSHPAWLFSASDSALFRVPVYGKAEATVD